MPLAARDIPLSSHSEFLARRRFGSLDGLRAISILAVIWHHTAPSWVSGAAAHVGSEGVSLFFAISGFLITTLLLRERDRRGHVDLKAFYWRRALRIFPLYYGVLLLYVALVWLLERHSSAGSGFFDNLIFFVTYTSNLFVKEDQRTIFYFAWSLATEEQFYLLWPPILVLCATLRRATLAAIVFTVMCIAGQLLGQRLLAAVPLAIVYGALVAMVLHTPRGYHAVQRLVGFAGAPVAILALLALAFVAVPVPPFVTHLLFAALVISCSLSDEHVLHRALSLRPMVYLGSISYGMYMLHMLCKNVVVKLTGFAGFPSGSAVACSSVIPASGKRRSCA